MADLTRPQIIHNAVLKARNDWLDYTEKQELAIWNLYNDAVAKLNEKILRYEVEGRVPPVRWVKVRQEVIKQMDEFRPKLSGLIQGSVRKSVDYGLQTQYLAASATDLSKVSTAVGTSFIGKDGKVRFYDARRTSYTSSLWGQINKRAMTSLAKFDPSGLMFSERIWKITYDSQVRILNSVRRAVLTGQSASSLSRDIRDLLIEPHNLFRRVRGFDGRLRPSAAMAAKKTGAGVYKSSYRNALRLARTELARAFHEGNVRYAIEKDWVDGVIWHVGSENPCEECEVLDGRFFPKDEVPELQHPNCMCYTDIHIAGDEKPERRESPPAVNQTV